MSRTFSAADIAGRALRMIGAWPVTESAPDGEQLREAMNWLDLIMSEVAGTQELGFLQPAEVSLTLVAGTRSYVLASVLGDEYPDDGIQFVLSAWMEDENAQRHEITILSKESFDALEVEEGLPEKIYLDMAESKTLWTWPTLPSDETETYTIKLRVQVFAPNISFKGVTGTQPTGTTLHKFAAAWQRFLTYRLAADIAAGPVAALPQSRINHFITEANEAWVALDGFQNREKTTEPPVAEPYGY